MMARVDRGTDAATIAAWDARRDENALSERDAAADVLEADAAEGQVCVLETGGWRWADRYLRR